VREQSPVSAFPLHSLIIPEASKTGRFRCPHALDGSACWDLTSVGKAGELTNARAQQVDVPSELALLLRDEIANAFLGAVVGEHQPQHRQHGDRLGFQLPTTSGITGASNDTIAMAR
jgi:hypothetical protein